MPKSKRKSKKQTRSQTSTDSPNLSLKEQLAQKRKTQKARQEFIQFATLTVLFGIVLGLVSGLAIDLKSGIALGVGIPTFALSYKYPRKALWLFLIYMPFGGTITYAIGSNALLQLAKDGFYIPALLGLIRECQQKRKPILIPKALISPLGILLALCLLTLLFVNGSQAMLPACDRLIGPERGSPCNDGQPLLMGILGLKVFLGYIPLIFCAYYLLRSKKELTFASRLHTTLAIACCALGFIQYMLLVTGACQGTDHLSGEALFRATIDARCFVGGSLVYSPSQGVQRLPGTFVAPWQWAWFLIANTFFTFATAFGDPSPLWRISGLVGMAAVFINAVISGQRIALALVPLITIILLILTGQIANLKRFIPIGAGLGALLGAAAVAYPDVVQERIDSFVSRWEASPPHEFILHQFEFTWGRLEGSPIGLGLGRATNSARVFGETTLVETWFPKIMHEVGPIGLAAFLAVVTTLTILTFKAYRSVRDRNFRSMGASYWVFILFISYQTYYYPLDVDPVAVYFWFFAGAILRLPEIDKQERAKRLTAEESEPRSQKKKRSARSARRRTVTSATR
jgi:hypothetical protein